MRRESLFWLFWLGGLLLAWPAEASIKLHWGGGAETNLFVGLHPGDNQGKFFNYMNTNVLRLDLKIRAGTGVAGRGHIHIRNINFSEVNWAAELEDAQKVAPVGILVQDLYVDVFGLFWEVMDLRVGMQRIAWGTGYGFNPTDNINPFNLENPLDFTRRLSVPAVKMTFYIEEIMTITAVVVPLFTPSVLPISLFKSVAAEDVAFEIPDSAKALGIKVAQETSQEKPEIPAFAIENVQLGGKIAWKLWHFNMSLSYYRGRLTLPEPALSDVVMTSQVIDKQYTLFPKAQVKLVYPEVHVAGFDLAGSLFGIGVWAEVAVFFPQPVNMDIKVTMKGDSTEDKIIRDVLEKEKFESLTRITSCEYAGTTWGCPYPKVAAGLDYTFKGGWYFNLQYLYGFFNELSADTQHHYVFLIFRKSFFRGRLLIQLTGGLEIDPTEKGRELRKKADPAQPETGLAFLVNPEIAIKPFDAVTITIGGVVARGYKGTTLKLFETMDQLYLRLKMDF